MKGGKKILVGFVFAAAVSGLIWYYAAGMAVPAETGTVGKGTVMRYIEDTATAKCRNTQTIFAEGAGRVAGIKADAGDPVKAGDLLAVLDKTSLELQLEDARAKIAGAEAQIKGTDIANYANRIEIAKTGVDQAEVAKESALRTYENIRQLYESDTSSREELDRAQDALKAATLALDAARTELDEVKRGATQSVRDGYQAALEQAVAYRDIIADNIRKQEIRATVDGMILEKQIDENSYLAPGTPAFTVGDNRLLELDADILADDAVGLKIGNPVEISGKATSDRTVKGKVIKIAPSAKTVVSALGVNQKRVPVTIAFEGDTGLLKPGCDIDIRIITQVRENVLVVPDSAIFDYKDGSAVFVVENGRTVIRIVKKGLEGKDLTEITDGIQEGDRFLVKPGNTVKAGSRIRGNEPPNL